MYIHSYLHTNLLALFGPTQAQDDYTHAEQQEKELHGERRAPAANGFHGLGLRYERIPNVAGPKEFASKTSVYVHARGQSCPASLHASGATRGTPTLSLNS